MTHPQTLGDRLGAARAMFPDLSARELDRISGTTEGHVGAVEAGAYTPKVDTLSRWARALGASLDWLVNGQGVAPTLDQVERSVKSARARLRRAERSGSAA